MIDKIVDSMFGPTVNPEISCTPEIFCTDEGRRLFNLHVYQVVGRRKLPKYTVTLLFNRPVVQLSTYLAVRTYISAWHSADFRQYEGYGLTVS